MSDAPDVDDRVDYEDGSSSEMEEEHVEEYEGEDNDDDNQNAEEHDVEEDNNIDIDIETAEDEEEEEREEYSHLLSLPPHGSEVFIGGLPRDVGEEDLRDLCEPIGDIFEVRLMKDRDSGESKGYAFVGFKTKDVAQKAIEELHSKQFKGKTIRCSLSETKNRLFIGNIPKDWTEDEFRKVIEDVGPGVESIELIKDPTNSTRNRGFAFVLYYNNACADYSRQKMIDSSFKLEGNAPTVTWADPKSSPETSAAAAQVKALYVKNIPENTSTEQLKELFQRHGEVTKVVTPPGKGGKRDFGFVHYAERSSALKAVKDSERYEINGQELEVVLAKPQSERKHEPSYAYGAAAPTPAPFALPTFGGFAAPPYGAMGIAGSFAQPMIYGRGAMPTGMQMVPMLLPDGRVGYVLQQPGMQMAPPARPRRDDRNNNGGSGRENRHDDHDGNRGGRRYRPY
ncbi:RNA-binding (RRM/RBD/RNP motifs) family protein [Raphanus sativus]|uniref:Heterogeneous nuclear ribonucleoprotein Q n=1 Tax=Raphanus sativus TaxID=3726 RepID=A0A6J0MS59_RAPSA|nr:heterogeneous nuclear ribonucleoprotein Q [Raphanus sativus]XP_018474382.1 heterogeneous nuclear ribonucleoprotein Q [Raphanus sativus]XP_056862006.1 heterogeneous nuclear ribonucleoprotein Q [Raphanus sativus]KAJ4905545.1 RNA-binding (RRM/RBD/RNP motifs) family protein [Raphanus sativus]